MTRRLLPTVLGRYHPAPHTQSGTRWAGPNSGPPPLRKWPGERATGTQFPPPGWAGPSGHDWSAPSVRSDVESGREVSKRSAGAEKWVSCVPERPRADRSAAGAPQAASREGPALATRQPGVPSQPAQARVSVRVGPLGVRARLGGGGDPVLVAPGGEREECVLGVPKAPGTRSRPHHPPS